MRWNLSIGVAECTTWGIEHVYVVPGNAGTAALYKASNRADTASDDYPGLVVLAKNLQIGLVVVGPDRAVVDGIEGYFRQSGIPCFAPTKEAAELEGSKSFAKDFMRRHNIPTARYENFNDLEAAKRHVLQIGYRVVIKASGLAAGKGVILPSSTYEAVKALEDILVNRVFGAAGSSVVVEECLEGQEISIHTLSDGTHTWSFPPGQDHKRVHDGDRGLNTGGMGVYTPTPFVTPPMMQDIETLILEPTFEGLRLEGRTFVGCLFSGVMLTSSGPKVLEYNTRFGDPETQSMIPLLDETTGLAEVFLACTQGKLDQVSIKTVPAFACNVVVAARGYPQSYSSGETIEIGKSDTDFIIFHAGTRIVDGKVTTAGGRVLAVAAVRDTLQDAVHAAYEGINSVKFHGMHYRKDIARRYVSPLRYRRSCAKPVATYSLLLSPRALPDHPSPP
ncbi:phosphoribosylamine-glycine ligase [Viridothelium virens]|uniref:phosphoribosylamine--glycine ligase n=1 Tax=Viridothelium virens TaxID=1048519 RepID=A0A6A6H134_VIRVR|nr:phosphoribosylamine-glycine ligase [Viridothelium virens]